MDSYGGCADAEDPKSEQWFYSSGSQEDCDDIKKLVTKEVQNYDIQFKCCAKNECNKPTNIECEQSSKSKRKLTKKYYELDNVKK
ncbi:unnamed protein product [Didymodactylos carnosus]|uniref:Uncharacterized protein n=1 Tax=Didymodactylos carnosus TaxID=1234261 RepID=A0A8S2DWT1_9BILA|nr:unnamed protein product [Didymodactylos carnosus]CAF3822489.1 unnamed protein product [Didymodactylos carnosus]